MRNNPDYPVSEWRALGRLLVFWFAVLVSAAIVGGSTYELILWI